jgi:two-component system chemotaxis response regulator CheY
LKWLGKDVLRMKSKNEVRILIVDDFATMRRVIRNLLEELGYSTKKMREAENGREAMEILDEAEIDLVVLDWNMPETPGIETLRWLRKHETRSQIPVLMVTAEATREQIVEAAEIGVNAYILKPFTADTLRKKLDFIFRE